MSFITLFQSFEFSLIYPITYTSCNNCSTEIFRINYVELLIRSLFSLYVTIQSHSCSYENKVVVQSTQNYGKHYQYYCIL